MGVGRAIFAQCHESGWLLIEAFLEHRYRAGLAPDVEATESWIQSKHVGIVRGLEGRSRAHRAKVNYEQFRVAFTGDERQAISLVDEKSMRVVARHFVSREN